MTERVGIVRDNVDILEKECERVLTGESIDRIKSVYTHMRDIYNTHAKGK